MPPSEQHSRSKLPFSVQFRMKAEIFQAAAHVSHIVEKQLNFRECQQRLCKTGFCDCLLLGLKVLQKRTHIQEKWGKGPIVKQCKEVVRQIAQNGSYVAAKKVTKFCEFLLSVFVFSSKEAVFAP